MAYTPEQVARLCDEFCDAWPKAENGPAHIVLSDYNFESGFIADCLSNIKPMLSNPGSRSLDELVATACFLSQLLQIPEGERVFPDPVPMVTLVGPQREDQPTSHPM